MRKVIISTMLVMVTGMLFSQNVINTYARITAINNNEIKIQNLTNQNGLTAGMQVIVMQMQDNVIGFNTSNSPNFGDLGDILSAGLWELATINQIIPDKTNPQKAKIILTQSLLTVFNINKNTRLQLISFPLLAGGSSVETSSDLTAKPWDGITGGVLAFQVENTLVLKHDLNVDGKGFRGGFVNKDKRTYSDTYPDVYYSRKDARYARKGEGIYSITDSHFKYGRGKMLTGGGGGNFCNGGGAGGGNFSAGGNAGPGYNSVQSVGGIGGIALKAANVEFGKHLFLGGGGGAGEGDNNASTAGANGGGIILVKAQKISTQTSQVNITANGLSSADTDVNKQNGGDGAGGAGAGGCIYLYANEIQVAAGNRLNIKANGGNGGDCTHYNVHAGGGGGGIGAIIFSLKSLPENVAAETIPGLGGRNSSLLTSKADDGQEGNGIILNNGDDGTLPVELLYFEASLVESEVVLKWATASEINNDYFEVEHSIDGMHWNTIHRLKGKGTTSTGLSYMVKHQELPKGVNYYRLKQVDFDGAVSLTSMRVINVDSGRNALKLYPNPVQDIINISLEKQEDVIVNIYSPSGKCVFSKKLIGQSNYKVDCSQFKSGLYFVRIIFQYKAQSETILVQ